VSVAPLLNDLAPRNGPYRDLITFVTDRPGATRYAFLRPIIPEVVEKFLECGDLARGFARIRRDRCKEDRLSAFSCNGRWTSYGNQALILRALGPAGGSHATA
jgi:hypothetical protein